MFPTRSENNSTNDSTKVVAVLLKKYGLVHVSIQTEKKIKECDCGPHIHLNFISLKHEHLLEHEYLPENNTQPDRRYILIRLTTTK